ncbi:ATP-binding protein [Pandoraea sp. E26]|uniref:ATP-binding protein n=1 Tax=Pandoraea sp. E26 TaxID=1427365 RepID=UPI000A690290|nr:ATP-binding protein [Pandoraea sp. E26]
MKSDSQNPWVERFSPLLNRETIAEKAALRPAPILDLRTMTPDQAGIEVEAAFGRIYYPSAQCVDILYKWITHAQEHCKAVYRDPMAHLQGVYRPEPPLPDCSVPICLTGPAGVGKSATVAAFRRVMPDMGTVSAADGTLFPLESHRAVTVGNCSTTRDLLIMLTGHQGAGTAKMLSRLLRKQAFRDGVSFLCLDEFQFVSQSNSANARVTEMLLSVYYAGLPWVYIANFSLLHKLRARNQEDVHRLLSKTIHLFPEAHDSADWTTLLEWLQGVAPDVFVFDPEKDARSIHNMTGGAIRATTYLLQVACANAVRARSDVDLFALERAYSSRDYAVFRNDIETSMSIHSGSGSKRKDLASPLQSSTVVDAEMQFQQMRQRVADEKALLASLTAKERDAHRQLQHEQRTQKPSAKVKTIKPAKNTSDKPKTNALLDNYDWFVDNL